MPTPDKPLADQIRPTTLNEFIGQAHLVGLGKPLYQAIKNNALHSMILWGPPGVGKTTLARILAYHTRRSFFPLSAVSAGKADVRNIVESVLADSLASAVLFLDEIHRFNKAQQDYLLPFVEDGTLILIGATTENPSFEVISALLSRCRIYVLEPLSADEIRQIVERGAQTLGVTLQEEAAAFLVEYSGGDARQALNLLDTAAQLYLSDTPSSQLALSLETLRNAALSRHLRYDKQAEEHYNTISAYIKSMRASDVDAALYYLARMVDAGEDPKFIARRIVIFASEDIGMALPTALVVANEAFRAVETIGYPECQINLAHATVYMALAPKDRSACDAYFRALEDVKKHGNLPIPLELRNAPTQLMKSLGYGKNYEPYPEGSLLPEVLLNKRYYPKNQNQP